MDEQIRALNKLCQDCITIRENLIVAASHYRDIKARLDQADKNKDPQMYSDLTNQMQICDDESMRLPAVVLGEWPHLAELYHHNFYEVKKEEGTGPINL